MEWGGRKLVLETGKVARQAEGAVLVTYGETEVLATVCAAKEVKADQDFFPLTVNYQEKYYATGKVPGGFMKREGKPSEREVLISRLIDRPIRPLFPDAFKNEVQVICTVLSHDQNTDSDIPAMIAASAALTISGIPFLGPIGAAKVGYIDGQFVLNPTLEQMPDTQLELSVAGTSEGVLMVESEANELSEETMLNAVMFGFESFQPVIKMINELKAEAGKPAWEAPAFPPEFDALYARIEKEFIGKYEEARKYYDLLLQATKPKMQDWMNAGHLYYTLGNIETAINYYQKAQSMCEDRNMFLTFYLEDKKYLIEKGFSEEDIYILLDELL